jgi:condensin-2 complex subunit H2
MMSQVGLTLLLFDEVMMELLAERNPFTAVEPRNYLDASTSKDASFYHFVKPPANLIVLEGDCLDTSGDGGELESYLVLHVLPHFNISIFLLLTQSKLLIFSTWLQLATNDLYQDFILLNPCDAIAVNDFLKADDTRKAQYGSYRGSSTRKTFQSPTRCSGGTAYKPSFGKNRDANPMQPPVAGCGFQANDYKTGPDPTVHDNFDSNHGFDMEDTHSEPDNEEDLDDDDDPWKPLNPHEPGNLKVKPFEKGYYRICFCFFSPLFSM